MRCSRARGGSSSRGTSSRRSASIAWDGAGGRPHGCHVLARGVEHRRSGRASESGPLPWDHPARLRQAADHGAGRPGMRRRLLLTGAGGAATSNLMRSLRAGYRSLTIVGCHSDRFLLKKSAADRNYLVPALTHPGYFGALRRVIAREHVDLLIPTTDAEVRAFTRARVKLPCRRFLPRKAVVDLCQDKYRLNMVLRSRGGPAPATYPVSSLRALEAIFTRLPAREPVWCW